MHFDNATKTQLLAIALHEDCPMDFKYEAIRELQLRWNSDMLIDLVRLYAQGKEVWEIAEYVGTDPRTIASKITHYNLWKKVG